MLHGGCAKCGLCCGLEHDVLSSRGNKLICDRCWERYYSESAKRDDKLKKLLKNNLCNKLKRFITKK